MTADPQNCRIRVYDHGKSLGFLCPGGKFSRFKAEASIMTRDNARLAVEIMTDELKGKTLAASFKIVRG